ncbi:MAG: LytR C-terminal domain-containing protein [Armatimonadetes bacterium]|nr:LytR C-terminal domain-containing protein [Armatimonadota bacterium]
MKKRILTPILVTAFGILGISIAYARLMDDSPKPSDEPNVSVNVAQDLKLDDVTAQQLLDMLKKKGYRFIVETTNIPKDKTFSVNVVGGSEKAVIGAVARALGLSVEKSDDIYVLRDGFAMPFVWSGEGGDGAKAFSFNFNDMFDEETLEKMRQEFKNEKGREMTPEERAEFEKAMESVQKLHFDFDKEHLKGLDEEILRSMKEHGLDKEHMKKLSEKLKKEIGEEGVFVMPFDDEDFSGDRSSIRISTDGNGKGIKINNGAIKKLLDSVTPSQKEKMARDGFLSVKDLTKQQLEILGNPDLDSIREIVIDQDGKKIRIVGKKESSGEKRAS